MNVFWTSLGLLFFTAFYLHQIFNKESPLEIQVRPAGVEARTTMDSFARATVIPGGILRIPQTTIGQRLVAATSDSLMDPIYMLGFVCLITIYLVFFRNLEFRNPFTKKTLTGVRLLLFLSVLLYFAAAYREYSLHQLVKAHTDARYTAQTGNMLLLPELLLVIAFRYLTHIFRKGYQLTLEQQYTV